MNDYREFEDPQPWSKDTDLPDVRWRKTQKELRIEELGLQLEFSRAIADLHAHPGWKGLVERVRHIESDETQLLRGMRMDSYELGRRQGLLLALKEVTRDKPMSPEAVDKAVDEIRLLQQQVAELRAVLA